MTDKFYCKTMFLSFIGSPGSVQKPPSCLASNLDKDKGEGGKQWKAEREEEREGEMAGGKKREIDTRRLKLEVKKIRVMPK